MLETIAKQIPAQLQPISGKVFYSGRAAFFRPSDVYVLGFNPGGDPEANASETVKSHTEFVLSHAPEAWSAYCDESWQGRAPGQAPLQRRLKHLLVPRVIETAGTVF